VKNLGQSIEYRSHIIDEGNQVWTSEMKIPFGKIGINPSDVGQMAFNMGVSRRGVGLLGYLRELLSGG